MKLDLLLDFYDPSFNQTVSNKHLQEMYKLSEQIWNSTQGLVEIPRPSFISQFSKAFQLNYASGNLLPYLDSFYPDDFLFVDCSYFPLSNQSNFELYRFLLLLDKEGVFLHLHTPIFSSFLKYIYAKDFRVTETLEPNPFGVKHPFIDVYNYPA